jgi:rRNA-processing protein FCF1
MLENLIIVDANFILLPFQFKIDYLREIEHKLQGKVKFIIFQQTIDELKAKAEREKKAAKFSLLLNSSLSYLERYKNNYNIVFDPLIKSQNETSDEFILRKTIELKKRGKLVYLATCDRELKKNAKNLKINLIFIRQKKMISIERA